MIYNLDIGTTYDIRLRAPAILGSGYAGATVLALLDYTSALAYEDVVSIHASVLPLLPTGTPSDPLRLIYVKLHTSLGITRVVALDWIALQPIVVSAGVVVVTIPNVSPAQYADIASALRSGGFTNFTMT